MGNSKSVREDTTPLLTPEDFRKNRDLSIDLNSVDRNMSNASQLDPLVRFQSIQTTVRTLQLDHTESSWSILSYVVAFLLLVAVPIFKLLFVKAADDIPTRQLVFQPVVAFVEFVRSIVSFVFLSHAFRKHGLRGFFFLDSIAEEVAQIQNDYDTVIELGGRRLRKLFVPSCVLYLAQSVWLYSTVALKPMPFTTGHPLLEVLLVLGISSLSWVFQTTTYLYACVLFWNVCKLQELKMRGYYKELNRALDTDYYVIEYERIKRDLKDTSHRFRTFLAVTGVISVSAALVSMYEVVDSINDKLSLCLWGDLIVLSLVNLTGAWQCLRSASKIAHLHRRIGRRAATMHARLTLQSASASRASNAGQSASGSSASNEAQSAPSSTSEDGGSKQTTLDELDKYCQRQEAWAKRAAVVEYLSAGNVGISVYGFILDRFFVHTSVGALLTTTWFILGRSLQG